MVTDGQDRLAVLLPLASPAVHPWRAESACSPSLFFPPRGQGAPASFCPLQEAGRSCREPSGAPSQSAVGPRHPGLAPDMLA